MSTDSNVFASAVQKAHVWMNDLETELEWEDRHKAYEVLKAALHALRDRLPLQEVAQLGAQLPLLIRGAYYEGWTPSKKPFRDRHKDVFLAHVGKCFERDLDVDPEEVVRAVFRVLARHVSEGEIRDIQATLPQALRELWD